MKHVPEHRLDQAHDRDVAELRAGAEPLRRRQRLEYRQPHDRAAREKAKMLERVHEVVSHRGLVEKRQVPDVEVDRPERQRDQRMREEPQPVQEGEHGPQDRPCQPREKRERREVAEQHVLQHVKAEELLTERVHGADECYDQQRDARAEHDDSPSGNVRATPAQRPHATGVEQCHEHHGHDLDGVERPTGVDRQVCDHDTSLP